MKKILGNKKIVDNLIKGNFQKPIKILNLILTYETYSHVSPNKTRMLSSSINTQPYTCGPGQ